MNSAADAGEVAGLFIVIPEHEYQKRNNREGYWTVMSSLKRQCHEIFCFWFFPWISFPPAPEYPIRIVSIFFWKFVIFPSQGAPPVSTTPVANCPQYQRHRRQICHRYQRHQRRFRYCCRYRWRIMGTLSGCWDLKVNLKAKMYL